MTETVTNPQNAASPTDAIKDAYKSLSQLSSQDSVKTLKAVWNYLQVYSNWCIRIPNDQPALNTYLQITNPGGYDFYSGMLHAYKFTSNTAKDFLDTVFPSVVNVGNNLQEFAQTAGTTDDGVFITITSILKTITTKTSATDANNTIQTQVLPLLKTLQNMATKNANNANDVVKKLSTYQTNLQEADSKLKNVDDLISKDASVSQETIDQLGGSVNVMGSINQLIALRKNLQKEYQKDKIIACTTPTYWWVAPPAGAIAATTVACVYAVKAVALLSKIDQENDLIKKDDAKLTTATAVHTVQSTAKDGLESVLNYTQLALTNISTVQNNWNTISSNLTDIQNELNNTTFGSGSDKKAQGKLLINVWLKQATTHWKKMIPLTNALVANSYITVPPGDKTPSEILAIMQPKG